MRKRIAAALDNGTLPVLRNNNLRLGSIVLQRADGKDAPALREVALQMARRGLNVAGAFDTFVPNISMRGSRTYATDVAGIERMIARRVGGGNRVTQAGRRFHQMDYARYMLQVPVVYERESTGARFHENYYPVTDNQLGWDVQLNVRGAPEQAMSQLHRFFDEWVASGAAQQAIDRKSVV